MIKLECNECGGQMRVAEKERSGCHNHYRFACDCGENEYKKELVENATELQKKIYGSGY